MSLFFHKLSSLFIQTIYICYILAEFPCKLEGKDSWNKHNISICWSINIWRNTCACVNKNSFMTVSCITTFRSACNRNQIGRIVRTASVVFSDANLHGFHFYVVTNGFQIAVTANMHKRNWLDYIARNIAIMVDTVARKTEPMAN